MAKRLLWLVAILEFVGRADLAYHMIAKIICFEDLNFFNLVDLVLGHQVDHDHKSQD